MTYESDRMSARAIPTIVTDLLAQLATLVHKEGQLARAEMSEKIAGVGYGLGFIVAGAVLLMPALVILLQAGVAALNEHGMAPYFSALIVGGGALVLGLILVLVGTSRLKPRNLVPEKTIHQFQRDTDVAGQQMRRDNDLQRAA